MAKDIRTMCYIVAVDFDMTLINPTVIEGNHWGQVAGIPMPDAAEMTQLLRKHGCTIIVHSCRATGRNVEGVPEEGLAKEMAEWMNAHGIAFDEIWTKPGKPIAHIYVDDRGLRFFNWKQAFADILEDKEGFLDWGRNRSALGIRHLLQYIGEAPDREGLADTPRRVLSAFKEMTKGYKQSPEKILARRFKCEKAGEMVVVRKIRFSSLCEHHLLPFVGTVTVGYIPAAEVVGLSKIPRLVLCFAKRLQIQEQMTTQIAQALQDALSCPGVGVIVTAHHSCMSCRGVEQQDADMVTSALLGAFRNPETRAEFLSIHKGD